MLNAGYFWPAHECDYVHYDYAHCSCQRLRFTFFGGDRCFICVCHTQLKQQPYMLINQSIIDYPTDFAHCYNLLIAQNTELMRNGGIISAKPRSQITNAQFTRWRAKQCIHNLQACRITENGKKGGDTHCSIRSQYITPDHKHMFCMD